LLPGTGGAQTATDSAAIHEASRQFSAAYVRGDAAAMVAFYTDDAVIFPERADMITGREAIRRYWTLRPGARITRHAATPARIIVQGDIAHDYGNYEVRGERDGQPWGPFLGKYVIVWRREPSGWKMQLDIWNSRVQPGQ
jgi:ketosteroid isomerase-like protein